MLIKLILVFLKIGFLGFGGGYAMLSLIFAESQSLGITTAQFTDLNALDVLLPGPIAINSATYVGQLVSGVFGGVLASLAVMVPSLIFIPLYLHYERQLLDNRYVQGALAGMKNAAIGLILGVAILLTKETIFQTPVWQSEIFLLIIMISGGYLSLKSNLNPLFLTILAGVLGYLSYYL